MMDFEQVKRFMVNDVIEVIPLAFMRGRTLNDSVIILDEAQNTTRGQMLMFLTRLGHDSKMIVTGDATQIDLPDADPKRPGRRGAPRSAASAASGSVTWISTTSSATALVQRIVEAYGDKAPKAEEAAQTREVAELLGKSGPEMGEEAAAAASTRADSDLQT